MKTVDVFGRTDGFNDALGVDVSGQGQLHQDAMDAAVVVQGIDASEQIGLTHLRRVALQNRVHAGVFAGLDLVTHIHLRGGVVTHQDHGQAGDDALGFESGDTLSDFGSQL